MSIALSREELEAARNLVDSEFPRQAISRAYYAAFSGAANRSSAPSGVPVGPGQSKRRSAQADAIAADPS